MVVCRTAEERSTKSQSKGLSSEDVGGLGKEVEFMGKLEKDECGR